VCAELANRGAKDVPIVYCGGLSGFPEAIEATLLDEGASPAEVITKHVEHWQRNYFRGCHCEYHLTGSVCRSPLAGIRDECAALMGRTRWSSGTSATRPAKTPHETLGEKTV